MKKQTQILIATVLFLISNLFAAVTTPDNGPVTTPVVLPNPPQQYTARFDGDKIVIVPRATAVGQGQFQEWSKVEIFAGDAVFSKAYVYWKRGELNYRVEVTTEPAWTNFVNMVQTNKVIVEMDKVFSTHEWFIYNKVSPDGKFHLLVGKGATQLAISADRQFTLGKIPKAGQQVYIIEREGAREHLYYFADLAYADKAYGEIFTVSLR